MVLPPLNIEPGLASKLFVGLRNHLYTSIHDHVVGHPKGVVQYTPKSPSVQPGSCFPRNSRFPQ